MAPIKLWWSVHRNPFSSMRYSNRSIIKARNKRLFNWPFFSLLLRSRLLDGSVFAHSTMLGNILSYINYPKRCSWEWNNKIKERERDNIGLQLQQRQLPERARRSQMIKDKTATEGRKYDILSPLSYERMMLGQWMNKTCIHNKIIQSEPLLFHPSRARRLSFLHGCSEQ